MKTETERKIQMCLERIKKQLLILRENKEIHPNYKLHIDAIEFFIVQIELSITEENDNE